jgi:hypothetical protein
MTTGDDGGTRGIVEGPNDETLFRRLCPRLEMRCGASRAPGESFFIFFKHSTNIHSFTARLHKTATTRHQHQHQHQHQHDNNNDKCHHHHHPITTNAATTTNTTLVLVPPPLQRVGEWQLPLHYQHYHHKWQVSPLPQRSHFTTEEKEHAVGPK